MAALGVQVNPPSLLREKDTIGLSAPLPDMMSSPAVSPSNASTDGSPRPWLWLLGQLRKGSRDQDFPPLSLYTGTLLNAGPTRSSERISSLELPVLRVNCTPPPTPEPYQPLPGTLMVLSNAARADHVWPSLVELTTNASVLSRAKWQKMVPVALSTTGEGLPIVCPVSLATTVISPHVPFLPEGLS